MISFIGSFDNINSIPSISLDKYAFIGRSNVGKSSLINSIVDRTIARISKTPGRTKNINLFNINDKVILVDLPGYGYAVASKSDRKYWNLRLEEYLKKKDLKLLFILIDSRIGLKNSDIEFIKFCDFYRINYQLVLTKKDKKVKEKYSLNIDTSIHITMKEEILETSSKTRLGIDKLREIIGVK